MPAITPATPLEAQRDMFAQRAKTASLFHSSRPVSHISDSTEIFDTDFEDDSDDEPSSPKGSFESQDSRRRSQTTISSYDEATTPSPQTSHGKGQFELRFQPVEGPKGPHLFRSSQLSAELHLDWAMQMSPVVAKEQPGRTETAFSDETVTPVAPPQHDFFLDAALRHDGPILQEDPEAEIRSWSTQQVIDWMCETGIDASVIECFDLHDINGTVLLDLHFDDLKELDIASFGKRHQLWNAICLLRGEDGHPSPTQTPFQDVSRPCTVDPGRSKSRSRGTASSPAHEDLRPATPPEKKRRGRKPSKTMDIVTPAESVSIVAIEQLLPRPHTCAKGEDCAKWRKQQRELQQLHDDHAFGRFPVSPTKGGRIFMAGNPGNAITADNMIPNVHRQHLLHVDVDTTRPVSEAQPSAVASSDLLGPGQMPDFALDQDMLNQLGSRDPQDNVKQFLTFQHLQPPIEEEALPSPALEMFPSSSFSPFPAQLSSSALQPPRQTSGPHEHLRSLPRLEIPRAASAGPQSNNVRSPQTTQSIYRSATASPGANTVYRLGTPASEMDVPITTIPYEDPLTRDNSQSVPPNMQFRPQQPLSRSHSRTGPPDWRRPSMALPAVKENEVFPPNSSTQPRPSISTSDRSSSTSALPKPSSIPDPSHHSPQTIHFGYGPSCSHSGWMKKRRTKMLRHEWQDSHFRLHGTQLTQHATARLSATPLHTIDVDDYAVACSTGPSNSKLAAAIKALHIRNSADDKQRKDGGGSGGTDTTAFAFQLIPAKSGDEQSRRTNLGVGGVGGPKTHHFAVRNKDERIDWMRELMLAKAREQKGKGYDVEVNGVQA